MGINQDTKGPLEKTAPPRQSLPAGAVWVTVYNRLGEEALVLPGNYYREIIQAQRSVSFVVQSYDAFATDPQILGLVSKGAIVITESDGPPAEAPAAMPVGVNPSSPNAWEREPPSDKVWHGRWNPRNPLEQKLKEVQDRLDAEEARREAELAAKAVQQREIED